MKMKCHHARGLLPAVFLAFFAMAGQAGAQHLRPGDTPEVLTSGLDIPWSVIWIKEEMLISQRRTGTIMAARPGAAQATVGTVPGVVRVPMAACWVLPRWWRGT